jgi:hypothetical protein
MDYVAIVYIQATGTAASTPKIISHEKLWRDPVKFKHFLARQVVFRSSTHWFSMVITRSMPLTMK